MFDVITLGETMLRLTPPHDQRLAQAQQLTVDVGGSESNVAVGLARLGLHVAWLSRLPRSPLGERVAGTLRGWSVDTSQVAWADDARLGLYFWEDAAPPRPNLVLYDRQGSAMSQMTPADLPVQLNGRHLHLSGITPALSAEAAATAVRAAELAQAAQMTISFDLNFRRKLWEPAQARSGCQPLLHAADLLLLPLRDAQLVLDIDPVLTPEAALSALAGHYPGKTIVLTLGEQGAAAVDGNGRFHHQPAISTSGGYRLGSGDAFAAGVIYGRYFAGDDASLAQALRWGVAMAALKRTIPGDMPLVDKTAVAQLASAADNRGDVR
ncbi:MAG: sugar kinase [Chloroflexota bacterium]